MKEGWIGKMGPGYVLNLLANIKNHIIERKIMASCEKCWGDAYLKAKIMGKSQSECYHQLLKEREDNPCSPREQAGQFWDEKKQCDSRKKN